MLTRANREWHSGHCLGEVVQPVLLFAAADCPGHIADAGEVGPWRAVRTHKVKGQVTLVKYHIPLNDHLWLSLPPAHPTIC